MQRAALAVSNKGKSENEIETNQSEKKAARQQHENISRENI
jgi:hypothetical protein